MVKPRSRAGRPSARAAGGGRASLRRVRIAHGALDVGGREVPLFGGAMHYFRLDPAAWGDGLRALREMGATLVETYIPWGVHELAPGRFDFGQSDPRKDLGAFVDLAGELGLWVWARPGPHINSEMTHFGLPERVIYDRACQARGPSGHPVLQGFPPRMFPVPSYASDTFFEEAGVFLDAVGEVLAPRMYPRGPVVLLQVDNEASLYFRDGVYDQDYHPDAIRHWHAFLAERHGTVAAMRRAYRSQAKSWQDVAPPTRFDADGDDGADAEGGLALHLDWAAHQETIITDALTRFRARMERAGLGGVPMTHNLPLGEMASPASLGAIETTVDVAGLDYYHARAEHRAVKRRTLYLAGTSRWPISPELGVGAPPWFTPLSPADSFFTMMSVLAWGVRGFSLYMAVDRDRWYGAPIDQNGKLRPDAERYRQLLGALARTHFHRLERRADVALVLPREYLRLARASSVLGFVAPTWLDALGGSPVDGASEDTFGFAGPIQIEWWEMLARLSGALDRANVPYVLVDSAVPEAMLAARRVLVSPSFEIADSARHATLASLAAAGTHVLYGPHLPSLDTSLKKRPFEVPEGGERIAVASDGDADDVVRTLLSRMPELRADVACHDPAIEVSVHHDETGPRVVFVIHPGEGEVLAALDVDGSWAFEDALSGERYEGESVVRVPMGGGTVRMLRVVSVKRPRAVGMRQSSAKKRVSA